MITPIHSVQFGSAEDEGVLATGATECLATTQGHSIVTAKKHYEKQSMAAKSRNVSRTFQRLTSMPDLPEDLATSLVLTSDAPQPPPEPTPAPAWWSYLIQFPPLEPAPVPPIIAPIPPSPHATAPALPVKRMPAKEDIQDDVGQNHPNKRNKRGYVWTRQEVSIAHAYLLKHQGKSTSVFAQMRRDILGDPSKRVHFHPFHLSNSARLRECERAYGRLYADDDGQEVVEE